MSTFKNKFIAFRRIAWECIKRSITPGVMYALASMIMLLIQSKYSFTAQMTWAVICAVGALAYNAFLLWVNGGSHYEMLVSGNMKRISSYNTGSELNISSYKYQKEYRVWKGFVIGLLSSIWLIVGSIVFGANQSKIVSALKGEGTVGTGFAVVEIILYVLAGWVLLPMGSINRDVGHVSFFFGLLFAILPIVVSGLAYIGGAYARRNKTLREQEIAARAAEAEANRPKKINYGGLPGTKPKKRK